ncbi:MAG: hypothetical protein IMX02_12715 [Limnochordaceae bacterium]|uniref:Uncharacterized protein n=1 Tax=Carboxydichorda subterranea TaxID=3109565 RepID=A0ABZ1BWW0_9FIRM|nr:hypothetical protein [Limnochorda sp. L945t]MBE3599597.1 hypothetical protein [Limnochordaceae bacterium]WRP17073.1 hypothetical protein U7230_13440 [Limnochorda sp. L945t]
MDLVDRLERVRLRLADAYYRLHQEGILEEAELEEAIEVIDQIEQLSPGEVAGRLRRLGRGQAGGASPAGGAAP